MLRYLCNTSIRALTSQHKIKDLLLKDKTLLSKDNAKLLSMNSPKLQKEEWVNKILIRFVVVIIIILIKFNLFYHHLYSISISEKKNCYVIEHDLDFLLLYVSK